MKNLSKRFLLMLLSSFICIGGIQAKRLSRIEAWQRVNDLPSMHKAKLNLSKPPVGISKDETEPIYIFNNEANQGFIIASGNDAYPPILGFSEYGNVNPYNIPPAMQELLDNYRKALTINRGPIEPQKIEATDIAPMLTTTWGSEHSL